jgi:NAD(P)H-flavin reductase
VKLFFEDEVGLIDIAQIHNETAKNSNYFISGPPAMIKSFKATLMSNGVPASYVLTDDWE